MSITTITPLPLPATTHTTNNSHFFRPLIQRAFLCLEMKNEHLAQIMCSQLDKHTYHCQALWVPSFHAHSFPLLSPVPILIISQNFNPRLTQVLLPPWSASNLWRKHKQKNNAALGVVHYKNIYIFHNTWSQTSRMPHHMACWPEKCFIHQLPSVAADMPGTS